jgi:hypothetical protein
MREVALYFEESAIDGGVVSMVEVAHEDEEAPDSHRLGFSARVHLLGVGEQRSGKHSQH